jgi:uncharacterized membrane protein YbhN (UPF0104 family)
VSFIIFEQDLKTLFKKYLFTFKLIVVGILISYLVYKISTDLALNHIEKYSNFDIKLILLATILNIFNWGLEAKKWQLLVKNITNLSYLNSFKSVLAGLSIGILTPNRLGNFIGRLAWIKRDYHKQATLNTMLGNLAQFVATISMGAIGLLIAVTINFSIANQWLIILTSILVITLAIKVYFKPTIILKTFLKQIFHDETITSIIQLESNSTIFKLNILGLSFLRYLVFLIQYFLLFKAFNVEQPTLLLFCLISVVYLLMTLIPSLFFGKLFVRESVAVFVFSYIGIETPLILIVAFLLWLINLALPAILGGVIWLNQSKKL